MKNPLRYLTILALACFVLIKSGLAIAGDHSPGNLHVGTPEVYTVEKGDTLWGISERFLSDPFKWPAIWRENDYVTNPDLIFPGNKLKLLPRNAPATPEPEKTVEAEEPNVPIRKAKAPTPTPTPLPKKYKLVPLENNADFINSAGFIDDKDNEVGYIAKHLHDGIYLSADHKAIIEFDGYIPKIGERFTIYSTLENIRHPRTKEKIGDLIKILGFLEVTEIRQGHYIGLIQKTFDAVSQGDKIRKFEDIPIPLMDLNQSPPVKSINGFVIANKDNKQFVGENSVIYFDRGKKDGVSPGDLFEIFHETYANDDKEGRPILERIGALRTIGVRAKTATGIVVDSLHEFGTGEVIRYASR